MTDRLSEAQADRIRAGQDGDVSVPVCFYMEKAAQQRGALRGRFAKGRS